MPPPPPQGLQHTVSGINDYEGLESFGQPAAAKPQRIVAHDGMSAVERLRLALSERHAKLTILFQTWDENGDQMISASEFRQALPLLGLKVERGDADALFAEFDSDGSGAVDYKELTRIIRPHDEAEADQDPLDTSRSNKFALRTAPAEGFGMLGQDSLDPASETPMVVQVQQVLAKNLTRVIDLFRAWDEDGSGTISRREFLRAMCAPCALTRPRCRSSREACSCSRGVW